MRECFGDNEVVEYSRKRARSFYSLAGEAVSTYLHSLHCSFTIELSKCMPTLSRNNYGHLIFIMTSGIFIKGNAGNIQGLLYRDRCKED